MAKGLCLISTRQEVGLAFDRFALGLLISGSCSSSSSEDSSSWSTALDFGRGLMPCRLTLAL